MASAMGAVGADGRDMVRSAPLIASRDALTETTQVLEGAAPSDGVKTVDGLWTTPSAARAWAPNSAHSWAVSAPSASVTEAVQEMVPEPKKE